jgi:hypothetical protein
VAVASAGSLCTALAESITGDWPPERGAVLDDMGVGFGECDSIGGAISGLAVVKTSEYWSSVCEIKSMKLLDARSGIGAVGVDDAVTPVDLSDSLALALLVSPDALAAVALVEQASVDDSRATPS